MASYNSQLSAVICVEFNDKLVRRRCNHYKKWNNNCLLWKFIYFCFKSARHRIELKLKLFIQKKWSQTLGAPFWLWTSTLTEEPRVYDAKNGHKVHKSKEINNKRKIWNFFFSLHCQSFVRPCGLSWHTHTAQEGRQHRRCSKFHFK